MFWGLILLLDWLVARLVAAVLWLHVLNLFRITLLIYRVHLAESIVVCHLSYQFGLFVVHVRVLLDNLFWRVQHVY